jgi:hypothetical protein
MKDPLAEKTLVDKFDEVRELIRTVYVRAGDRDYRLEIYRHYTNAQTPYVVGYFVRRSVPSLQSELKGGTADAFFLDNSLPWVSGTSPEQVLGKALAFLKDRQPNKAREGR